MVVAGVFWPKRVEPIVVAGFDWKSGALGAADVDCWPKSEPGAVVAAAGVDAGAAEEACPKRLVPVLAGFVCPNKDEPVEAGCVWKSEGEAGVVAVDCANGFAPVLAG